MQSPYTVKNRRLTSLTAWLSLASLMVGMSPAASQAIDVPAAPAAPLTVTYTPCASPEGLETTDPRLVSAIQTQDALLRGTTSRLEVLLNRYATGLTPVSPSRFTPEMDRWIDAEGKISVGGSLPTSEAVIWGYINTPKTVLTAKYNPLKHIVYGGGYQDAETAYGFDPSAPGALTNDAVLKHYESALKYLQARKAGKEADKRIISGVVRLGVGVGLATLLAIPTMGGSVTLAALSTVMRSKFTVNASVFVQTELASRAEKIVTAPWAPPGGADAVLAANVEQISALASGEVRDSSTSIYSLYRETDIKLNSISEMAESLESSTGVSPSDSTAFALGSLEASKAAAEISNSFEERWNKLEASCAQKLQAAVSVAEVKSRTRAKDADMAFASLLQAKTECLASEYVLLLTEIRWMTSLSNSAIRACTAMAQPVASH